MFKVDIENDAITAALDRLLTGMGDMTDAMNEIGAYLRDSTKDRFADEKSPEGVAWAARSPVTLARYLATNASFGGILHKTGDMGGTIKHEYGPDFAEVGSNSVQSGMMQFGGTRAAYPHLWGDIPARPFLGISDEDEGNVIDIIDEYLTGRLGAT